MPAKKRNNMKCNNGKDSGHPSLKQKLTFSQRSADRLANIAGSWSFIFFMLLFIALWVLLNIVGIMYKWDVYPFILLNLILSILAAMQAPVILMSQNRAAERDRINAKYDYQVNRKAEREIQKLQKDMNTVVRLVRGIRKKKR